MLQKNWGTLFLASRLYFVRHLFSQRLMEFGKKQTRLLSRAEGKSIAACWNIEPNKEFWEKVHFTFNTTYFFF
jgi:hypothetical protein